MRKVKQHFYLVGRADDWKRYIPRDRQGTWTNEDTIEFIKDTVAKYFGSRAVVVLREETLKNDAVHYPKFYSAGWFVSLDTNPTELVVIGHGETMEESNKNMSESVKMLDWDRVAVRI